MQQELEEDFCNLSVLEESFTEEEIKHAVFNLVSKKSSEADRFLSPIINDFEALSRDIFKLFQGFFNHSTSVAYLSYSFIARLKKIGTMHYEGLQAN